MKIKLLINGKERTFTAPFVSARMLQKTFELEEKYSEDKKPLEFMQDAIKYIVDLFGNQFTYDELLDGLGSSNFFTTFYQLKDAVVFGFQDATADLLDGEDTKKNK